MKARIPYRSYCARVLFIGALAAASFGCKAAHLTGDGTKVVVLYDEPVGCENLGVVVGRGGGLTGAYSKPTVNQESAENDARNQAAQRGATHLLLHPEEVAQGDGRGPDYQDTQPAMAHGSGTGSTISVAGTAYKCALATPETKSAVSIRTGAAVIAVNQPTPISFAPLGPLERVIVFRRVPLPSGTSMGEDESLVLTDPGKIRELAQSLEKVVADPLKFIPTHRVEFVGELGTQSLLYGFGYLQYAGKEYRLTDGVFEEVLELRESPKGPDIETEPPSTGAPSAPEAP